MGLFNNTLVNNQMRFTVDQYNCSLIRNSSLYTYPLVYDENEFILNVISRIAPTWIPIQSDTSMIAYIFKNDNKDNNEKEQKDRNTLAVATECLLQIDMVYNVSTIIVRGFRTLVTRDLDESLKILSKCINLIIQTMVDGIQNTFPYTVANEISFVYAVYIPNSLLIREDSTIIQMDTISWPGLWQQTTTSARITIISANLSEPYSEYYVRLFFDKHYTAVKELIIIQPSSKNSALSSASTTASASASTVASIPSATPTANTSLFSTSQTTPGTSSFLNTAPMQTFSSFSTANGTNKLFGNVPTTSTPFTSTFASSDTKKGFNLWG